MANVFDTLKARGFIKQTVFEEDLYKMLETESVPFYIGFDPTADSLHVGHFLQLMAMSHMQKAGHKPIVLIGGGTAMIGDPSGRSDLRSMMTVETIQHNCDRFKEQMSKFFTFEGENAAVMANNADWLLGLNYVEFLRDIGVNFSVNRMLSAECYKQRLEKGLTFLEFNYMLMQGYDFLELYRRYGCQLECGGDDQWSNILAGADLIRRKEQKPAYAMTFKLLTTSEGKKMGKTAKGAVWLDPEKTTPYDFYQYWRNVDDGDVKNCLCLLTYMDLEEIDALCQYDDERINNAKMRLAFEVTKIVHGEDTAKEVEAQVKAAFAGDVDSMEATIIPKDLTMLADILVYVKAAPSKSEAKRLIKGNSVAINDKKVTKFDYVVSDELMAEGFKLTKGKKVKLKIQAQ